MRKPERRAPGLPVSYKPERGLKTIAVAEAAERHYRRAKDAEQLLKAVALKLTEQRKFVLWWDQQAAKNIGRPKKTVPDRERLFAARGGIPERKVIHRWRVKLASDAQFALTLERAQAQCLRICEVERGDYSKASYTGEFEWYTPGDYLELARRVLGEIDLDPASSEAAQRQIRAAQYFTTETDGLQHEWHGRIWLNPPYMQPAIAHFVEKLCTEIDAQHVTAAIMLTHNYTDAAWFHRAVSFAQAICFTRGRIAFEDPQGTPAAPTQGQAFFYVGPNVDYFAACFADVGFIVRPWR